MDWNLQGKVALVTGGGNGIGKSIAIALLDAGCEVCIADLRADAAKAIKEFNNPKVHFINLDVGDAAAVQLCFDTVVRERGRIDILVNSAGILKTRPLAESTFEDWDQVLRVNLSGVYYCSKAVLPHMVAARSGKIINMASVSSVKGGGAFGNVLYGASKAGVVALSQGFARELAPYGINVNAISPGVVDGTPMTDGLMTPEVRQRIVDSIPMKRMVRAPEVAMVALFLASDLAQGITGQTIVIDGGFLVR
jgi:NAD(P)-dependent dehydrogenase (short-subunit alcohol dehydrogenase family)